MPNHESLELVRALIYGVQFAKDPIDGIDRVMEKVVNQYVLETYPEMFLAAVRAILVDPPEPDYEILPGCSVTRFRDFLMAMEVKLQPLAGKTVYYLSDGWPMFARHADRDQRRWRLKEYAEAANWPHHFSFHELAADDDASAQSATFEQFRDCLIKLRSG